MADAVAVVHARTAERGGVDLLAERLADDAGPVRNIAASSVITIRSVSAGEYAPPPAEAPETTEICGTTPVSADGLAEDPPVAAERRGALLHPRAARLDEPDDRDPTRAPRSASTRTIVSAWRSPSEPPRYEPSWA